MEAPTVALKPKYKQNSQDEERHCFDGKAHKLISPNYSLEMTEYKQFILRYTTISNVINTTKNIVIQNNPPRFSDNNNRASTLIEPNTRKANLKFLAELRDLNTIVGNEFKVKLLRISVSSKTLNIS
ncbi:hypothetical protein NBO_61g0006 [Nosema bombycis CQ1]|uniref:Uncharacterized protein n=1 Tax=Nosema bombycis (strain CQ1 / CVCC 102059) TaxID=578461 RepID=R0MHV9_NOSB1|nr:hypothetical protein NBO_61g0006 [Nosema bombycis CQ1]|eukprot:EOB13735.1 hypothetical protein NBO_61g0006 [Nosema bombycis CQ1]